MRLPCRAPFFLLLLLCSCTVWAQQHSVGSSVEGILSGIPEGRSIEEHAALQRAEKQEEATEHAPISHEKAPAALEDVDEFKGERDVYMYFV
jgi:hypothetical protein